MSRFSKVWCGVGTTSAEVELYLGEISTIAVITVDNADNESQPGYITVIP